MKICSIYREYIKFTGWTTKIDWEINGIKYSEHIPKIYKNWLGNKIFIYIQVKYDNMYRVKTIKLDVKDKT